MKLSQQKISRIKSLFGEKGDKYLEQLGSELHKYIPRWKLSDLIPIDEESVNLLFYCNSHIYGNCILKLGVPHNELFWELQAYEVLRNDIMCAIFAFDKKSGAKLLKRIIPGDSLKTIEDNEFKLRTGLEILPKIPKLYSEQKDIPSVKEWINRAFSIAKNKDKRLDLLISAAKEHLLILDTEEEYILHGDLHHQNILRSGDNDWKVIDPKGVRGPKIFESAVFMNNHFDLLDKYGLKVEFEDMIKRFAQVFNTSEYNIAASLFLQDVLSLSWTFEEEDPDKRVIERDLKSSEFVLEYLKSIQ